VAKSSKREYAWLQCTECDELNYRTSINTQGEAAKLELRTYCARERKRTVHKVKKK